MLPRAVLAVEYTMDENKKARSNAELFHHLIEGIEDIAIFMIAPDGQIMTWNPGVERLLRYGEDDFVGRHISVIFTDEDARLKISSLQLESAADRSKVEDERWFVRKDGRKLYASVHLTAMREASGTLKGFAAIMRDNTTRKEFENQFTQQAKLLAAANEELKNFAAIVSHDLKAPLQTIFGFATLLSETEHGDEETEESIHHILDSSKRMMDLVQKLLLHASTNGQATDLRVVDSGAVLEETLVSLFGTIHTAGAVVTHDQLPTVWGDATQMGRVFQNLVENALKYARKNVSARIHVSSEQTPEGVVFCVRDNSMGIAQDQLDKIFGIFHRSPRDASAAGTGLGLSVCRKMVNAWGGRIWVTSKVDSGSSFYFSVPATPDLTAHNGRRELLNRVGI